MVLVELAGYDAGVLERLFGASPDDHIRSRIARSEEHTSELQSRPHISYAVFCLKKKIGGSPPPESGRQLSFRVLQECGFFF